VIEVEVHGRVRRISIEPVDADAAGGSFRLTVDGAVHEVELTPTDLGVSLRFADGRVVDAALTPRGPDEWLVQLPRAELSAIVDGRRHLHGGPAGVAVAGEHRVTAPMPGRVLRILVTSGQSVAERQGLVVVEAMKMENEIGAPKAGRVKEVAVSEGASIEAGRLLVVVE
jgi:biotin carboxyl carrier protein